MAFAFFFDKLLAVCKDPIGGLYHTVASGLEPPSKWCCVTKQRVDIEKTRKPFNFMLEVPEISRSHQGLAKPAPVSWNENFQGNQDPHDLKACARSERTCATISKFSMDKS